MECDERDHKAMTRRELPKFNCSTVQIRIAGEEVTAVLHSEDASCIFLAPLAGDWESIGCHYLTEAEIGTLSPAGHGNLTSAISILGWSAIE